MCDQKIQDPVMDKAHLIFGAKYDESMTDESVKTSAIPQTAARDVSSVSAGSCIQVLPYSP